MRRLAALLLACAGCSGSPTPHAPADLALPDGGILALRPYDLDVPAAYDSSVAHPLLVLLHGYASNGADIEHYFGIPALVEARQLLVALPEGTRNSAGYRFWNATDACCDYELSGVDDVGYLDAVIDDVEQRYNIDARRVFVAGHSNGGFMAHRLACDSADRVTGIVSLAGVTWEAAALCQPSAPVAVLQVHGDHDDTIPFSGTLSEPSAVRTVATWAMRDGCSGGLQDTGTTLDLDASLPGSETSVSRWDCPAGAAELWDIHGAQHEPDLRLPEWSDDFFDWLMQHPR